MHPKNIRPEVVMTTENLTRVWQRLQGYRAEAIELQRELVRRPAIGPDNGGPGEGEKAAFLQEYLEKLGLQVQNYPAPDPRVPSGERPNLVAVLPGRSSAKVWVLSHLDVVPEGERHLWHSDPFDLRVEGDLLYGRGVEDNHQGIVTSILAVKALLAEGLVPPRSIALALVADEETGSQKGLAYLLREHRDLFSPADLIIVPDAGSPDGTLIEIAEKSILWLRLEILGRQGHASRPDLAVNTLRACAHLIVALEALKEDFPATDPFFEPPGSTFEPTKKEANVQNINTIPGQDVFYLDCRVLPCYQTAQVIQRVRELAQEIERRWGVTINLTPIQDGQSPPPTPVEAPVVQALIQAIAAVYQRQARPRGIGGGTVAAFFRQAGLPAAVWMTTNETAHQPNEHVDLKTLLSDAQVLAHVFLQEV